MYHEEEVVKKQKLAMEMAGSYIGLKGIKIQIKEVNHGRKRL